MNRLNSNILGVCEARWVNNEDFVSDKHSVLIGGGAKNERVVGFRVRHEEMHSGILSTI